MAATATKLQPPALEGLITEGPLVVTPEMASRILEEANYVRQRTLKPLRLYRQVTRLQALIQAWERTPEPGRQWFCETFGLVRAAQSAA